MNVEQKQDAMVTSLMNNNIKAILGFYVYINVILTMRSI